MNLSTPCSHLPISYGNHKSAQKSCGCCHMTFATFFFSLFQFPLGCVSFKSDSLGIPSLFAGSPMLGRLMRGAEPSQKCKNFFGTIVLQFLGHPPGGYRIWFYHDFAPTIFAASPLSLDVVYLFSVGSNSPLSMAIQQSIEILVFSQEEMSSGPSIPPTWW